MMDWIGLDENDDGIMPCCKEGQQGYGYDDDTMNIILHLCSYYTLLIELSTSFTTICEPKFILMLKFELKKTLL